MRLWKKRDAVKELVFDHLKFVHAALEAFEKTTRACFVDADFKKAGQYALETHRAEGKADDIRRSVEKAMITGALLPPSRRQILELVERADTLANAAEASVDTLLVQRVNPPEAIIPTILKILEESLAIYEDVECAIRALFEGKPNKVLEHADRIEQGEGKIDHLEREALKELFSSDIDLAEKLHAAGYLDELVKISDRSEDLADRLALIVAERAY